MAMNNQKVLLIDGDLRLPQLAGFFNLKKSKQGLVDVVTKGLSVEEVIVQPIDDLQFLHILPPGKLPPLPSAIFNSPAYAALIDYLLGIYDYILIDTPPLLFASELMAIAKHVDGLAVNVRAGISTKGGVKELLDNLDMGGVNVLGAIFNGVIESKMGGHYSGGRYYAYKGYSYNKQYYNTRQGRMAGNMLLSWIRVPTERSSFVTSLPVRRHVIWARRSPSTPTETRPTPSWSLKRRGRTGTKWKQIFSL